MAPPSASSVPRVQAGGVSRAQAGPPCLEGASGSACTSGNLTGRGNDQSEQRSAAAQKVPAVVVAEGEALRWQLVNPWDSRTEHQP